MKACCLAIPCVLLALITGRAEASITINSSQVYALGDDFTGSSQYQTFNGTTIPTRYCKKLWMRILRIVRRRSWILALRR